ncbi:hypothetical protein IEQ34_002048 [Dendrobium chrysotoxum]|uniref:Gnk2-homologous domain-containing protein n=1 Tax=Dendrobium chrysotoxum TaxID=161865 RepID=A0AAV7HJP1_DENCH|nr:hypothetical protein IEQ34_002048 [Dendrobium chrysotoxum]
MEGAATEYTYMTYISMAFSNHLLFLFVLIVLIISGIKGDDTDLISKECGKNFTNNDNLQANINSTIFDLVTKTSAYGFANSSHGSGSDTVYGIAECRGDVSVQTCSTCIANAAQQIQTTCWNAAESRIWYQYCFLYYNTSNFIGQADINEVGVWYSTENTTNPKVFQNTLNELSVVLWLAASDAENRKFGWGQIENHNLKNSNDETIIIYGMAQCTWDLDNSTCSHCLLNAFNIRESKCGEAAAGCYVITKSCAVRYEVNPFLFFNATAVNPPETTSSIIFGNI